MIEYGYTGLLSRVKHIKKDSPLMYPISYCGCFIYVEGEQELQLDFNKLRECKTCRKMVDSENSMVSDAAE